MNRILILLLGFLTATCGYSWCVCDYEDGACKPEEKHWSLPLTFDCNISYQYFDNCHKKSTMSQGLFGENVTFKDLSLFIKLCADNHVRLQNISALPPSRGEGDLGVNPPFGDYSSDLYTTLIAPVTVSFTGAQEKEETVNASLIYRFMLDDLFCRWWAKDIAVSFGMTVPFKNKQHQVALNFLYNGTLFQQIFSPTQTVRETTIYQFFVDFTDVNDYFMTQILGPKNLVFEPNQRKIGLGDITLFASVELLNRWCYLKNWQSGITIVTPSGGRPCGNKIWEVVLGNGGATQFDFYSNMFFETDWGDVCCVSFLNPAIRFAAEGSASFCSWYRIPQTISATPGHQNMRVQVQDIPGLDAPARFNQFYVDPFTADETTSPWFAGQKTMTRVKYGPQVLIGFSDFIYHIMYDNCRVGLFYDYSHKGKDRLHPLSSPNGSLNKFNTESIEKYTRRTMHRLGWNLTYKFENYVELTLGSQHIVAGKNVPRSHDVYLTAALVF